MNIVFMGTPDFAAHSMKALIDAGHNVQAAFTQPDRPKGRGNKVTPPPVKVMALENGIPVYQPLSVKSGEDAEMSLKVLKELSPDVIVAAAYGKILPPALLTLPKYGCINVHGSLLPTYRGAAPVQRCLINGEKETGITVMQMAEGMDTGDMLLKESTPIDPEETFDELMERLGIMGGKLLVKALENIDTLVPEAQDESLATYAPMITKDMALIDFSKTALEVHDLIRGLSSNPGAYFMLGEKRIKVYRSTVCEKIFDAEPGLVVNKSDFTIACGDKKGITLKEVQAVGGKRMKTEDFLRGNKL
ncbi:MAG: methionyl-tRNA formyltransferase [Oscillospiraceae bacterium]|nr:methionyl-tRNA formyltransferase [Oscillospiraceae bacterium]